MSIDPERLNAFQTRMNEWVSGQGLLFQLSHGGTVQGGKSAFFAGMMRLVVRGIRSWSDYEHEWSLAHVNRRLAPGVESVYFLARPELAAVSSSLVRDVARHDGPLENLVPPSVAEALADRD